MKVCFIVGAFPNMKCGVGDYTYNIAKRLAKNNMEVYIITSTKACNLNEDNIVVNNVISKWDFGSKDIILDLLKSINPDVVHIQYSSDEYGKSFFVNFLPKIIRNNINTKIVQTVHEYINYTFKGKLKNLINYKYADEIIVVEKQYKLLIKKFIPIISSSLSINYVPISSNIPLSNLNNEELICIRNGLFNKKDKVICFFGFINELKGVDILIEILNKIVEKNKNTKLLIIGELNKDNEYHKFIMNRIQELNLEEYIVITGFLKNPVDVSNYIKLSDCAVFPFKDGVSERNGSFLAAYNQNIPIITTTLSTEYNNNGVWYINPKNIMTFVESILYILNNKLDIKREIIDWENIVEKHYYLYKK